MGLTGSNWSFQSSRFYCLTCGKRRKEKKIVNGLKEKGIEKEWKEGRKEGRKERRKEGSKEGRIQTIRGKIRRRNFNKN